MNSWLCPQSAIPGLAISYGKEAAHITRLARHLYWIFGLGTVKSRDNNISGLQGEGRHDHVRQWTHNREFINIYLQWEVRGRGGWGVWGSNCSISGARPRIRGDQGHMCLPWQDKTRTLTSDEEPAPLLWQLPGKRVNNTQNVWLTSQNLASWWLVQRATSKNSWQREKARWWTGTEGDAWPWGGTSTKEGCCMSMQVSEVAPLTCLTEGWLWGCHLDPSPWSLPRAALGCRQQCRRSDIDKDDCKLRLYIPW